MEENRKHIDKLFSEGLGNYTEHPAPDVWASLEQKLDNHYKGGGSAPHSYKWLWYVLLALVAALVIYYAMSSANKNGSPSQTQPSAANSGSAYVIDKKADGSNNPRAANDIDAGNSEITSKLNNNELKNTTPQKAVAAGTIEPDKTVTKKNINPKEAAQQSAGSNKLADTKVAGASKKPLAVAHAGQDYKHRKSASKTKAQAINIGDGTKSSTIANGAPALKQQRHKIADFKRAQPGTDDHLQHRQPNGKKITTAGQLGKKQAAAADNEEEKIAGNVADKKAVNEGSGAYSNNNTTPSKLKRNSRKPIAANSSAFENNREETAQPVADKPLKKHSKTHLKKGTAEDEYGANRNNSAQREKQITSTARTNHAPKNPGKITNPVRNGYASGTQSKASPKKTAPLKHKAPAKNNSRDDSAPTVTFGNDVAPKRKADSPVKETTKPDVNWQKGFTADDSRGLKTVKAGTAGEAGTDNEEEKTVTPGKGGGGGGGSSTGKPEKKKKNKEDRGNNKIALGGGFKLGYEQGFGSYQANKIVAAPYMQYTFATGLAVVLQPSFKYAMLNKTDIGDPKSYYRITNSSLDSNHTPIPPDSFGQPAKIIRRYHYSQTNDSIVVNKAIKQKTYYEFELPVMLQYQVSKKFAAYLGVAMNYSKILQIEDKQTTFNGTTQSFDDNYTAVPVTDPAPAKKSFSNLFSYSIPNYNSYVPSSTASTVNSMRFSYTLGFNYLFTNRFMFDVMFVKMLSDAGLSQDTHVQEIYKQGYLRLSLGYKFK